MLTAPGTPVAITQALRGAFTKALGDPELLAESAKKTMEVELITGEDLQTLAKEVVSQPPEILARMKKLLGE